MKIVIHTQHRENYGAHDWNGEGECPQRWKNKGGDTYILRDVTVDEAMNAGDIVTKQIAPHIDSFSDMFEEFIMGWELLDDCEPDPVQEWESPINLVLAQGRLLATQRSRFDFHNAHGLIGDFKQWVQVGGRREDFVLMYEREDGSMITYSEWVAQQEAA